MGVGGLCWDACCCNWEVEMSQLGGALGWDESPVWGCISVTAHTCERIRVCASTCEGVHPHVCEPPCVSSFVPLSMWCEHWPVCTCFGGDWH